MDTELTLVRTNMIHRIADLIRMKEIKSESGLAKGDKIVPLYSEEDYDNNISIEHNSEDVWFVKNVVVPARALGMDTHDGVTVERIVVETDNETYYIDELYADDIETIMEKLERIDEDEIKTNEAWLCDCI